MCVRAYVCELDCFHLGLTLTYKEMFNDICKRYWEWRLKEFPTFATVQKNHNYDHVLEDFSLEAFDRRKVVFRFYFYYYPCKIAFKFYRVCATCVHVSQTS